MIISKDHFITKSTGETQRFEESKLNKYLISSGVNEPLASQALLEVEKNLNNIKSTDDIYQKVCEYLKNQGALDSYFNYSLKRAVMQLGPSGHPFEHLVSEVLATQGYRTEVGVTALGKCVTHEIDVVASNTDTQYFIECKFHNTPGIRTDIQVALYTYARFLDVKLAMEQTHGQKITYLPWLITNTKVTSEVFDYGNCNNLKVTAWYYPNGEGLRDMITASRLHPITLLYHISPKKISALIESNIVTITSLRDAIKNDKLKGVLSDQEMHHVLEDIKYLYKNE